MLIGAPRAVVDTARFQQLMDKYVNYLGAKLLPYVQVNNYSAIYFGPTAEGRISRADWDSIREDGVAAGIKILGAHWYFTAPTAGRTTKVPAGAPEATVQRMVGGTPEDPVFEDYLRTFEEYMTIEDGTNGESLYYMEVLDWDPFENKPTIIHPAYKEYYKNARGQTEYRYGGMAWDTIQTFIDWAEANPNCTVCCQQEANEWVNNNVEGPV